MSYGEVVGEVAGADRAEEDGGPLEAANVERPSPAELRAPGILQDPRVDVVELPAEQAALRQLLAAHEDRRLHAVADDLVELVADVGERWLRLGRRGADLEGEAHHQPERQQDGMLPPDGPR